jgi:hypothetical protein
LIAEIETADAPIMDMEEIARGKVLRAKQPHQRLLVGTMIDDVQLS